MILTIIISFTLASMILDYIAYRRIKSDGVLKLFRFAFFFIIAVSYLSLLATPLLIYKQGDSGYIMRMSMILLTVYLALSIPRLFFYIFWLLVRSRIISIVSGGIAFVIFLIFIFSAFVTRTDYKLNRVSIDCSRLPESFDGYKVAFISDIHTGSMLNPVDEIKKIIGIINDTDADIVFFGGDIININHSEVDESLLKEYSHLKARDGVFMVLGNHDTGAYMKGSDTRLRLDNTGALVDKMECAGWCVLRDSTVYIRRSIDSIAVTGIDFNEKLLKYKHSTDVVKGVDFSRIYGGVPDSVFNITLSHLPQLWHSLCDGGYSDLTLSGHIHAMQMKIGALSPARLMYKEWSGLYKDGDSWLYINDGIGCVGFLARIGACPEVTLIELHKKN